MKFETNIRSESWPRYQSDRFLKLIYFLSMSDFLSAPLSLSYAFAIKTLGLTKENSLNNCFQNRLVYLFSLVETILSSKF